MKAFKKYFLYSLPVAVLSLTGCTGEFDRYNTDPNALTREQMLGDNVLVGQQISAIIPSLAQGQQNNSQMIDQMIGAEYGGAISCIALWGNSGNFYTYDPRVGWQGIPFTTMMPQIYTSYFKIKQESNSSGVVYHWAQILRVAASLRLSDIYGPIPYSKVTSSAQQVPYDSMADLYTAMFADLEEAINAIKPAVLGGEDFSSLADFDYVYKGDFTKWLKFANTLKLRMAMRLVNVDATLAKTKAEEAVADPIGVMTASSDAAWSTFNDGMNPFYRAGFTWGGGGGEFALSANITSYLTGYNDPRLSIYSKDGSAQTVGVRNGIFQSASTFATYQGFAKPNIGQNDPLLIMSAAEAYFLRAEMDLRGWDGNGTAKDLYEQGVTVAMQERGASIGSYLSGTNGPADYTDPSNSSNNATAVTTISPKFDTGATLEENLERIMIQKWLATFPSGWEAWADIRRTGYPKFFPVVNNRSSVVNTARGMRRIPYPQSEYNTNDANVRAAVVLLGGADNAATDLWWAKKN